MAESSNQTDEKAEKVPITGGPLAQPPPSYDAIPGPASPAPGPASPPSAPEQQCPYPPYPNLQAPPGTVVAQPQLNPELRNDWMTIPRGVLNCPRGLEYLTTLDQLMIMQKVSMTEALCGFETNNKYIIRNNLGQNVYIAKEDNDCCTRNCCGACRPFDMKVMDLYSNEIIHFYRPLRCTGCCYPCCMQSIEIASPPGEIIGHVKEEWTCWFPNFKIQNHLGDTVLRIEGPCCTWSCCSDIDFKIVDLSGNEIGKISKKWSGMAREYFTDSDNFGVNFPIDLDVRMKAVLVGACILIDMMYFENNEGKNS